ncbi:hypothetical protein Niako_1875 [Niastella koreensis GR20-10]|uniref:Uncharacterized protein n=1 Tax=Niastella koreensis (strain DSM 17620 / KACC 11465 / NBRC 106392 / GR20-10) TaxID=700598 RepID=G8TBV1_NIAKG|nr:hypothetical protein Niako_1875 [Niastella koreensis GR20-10]
MSNITTNTDPCLINKPGIQVDLKQEQLILILFNHTEIKCYEQVYVEQ